MRVEFAGETEEVELTGRDTHLDYVARELVDPTAIYETIDITPSCLNRSDSDIMDAVTQEFADSENVRFFGIMDSDREHVGYTRGVTIPFDGESIFYGLEHAMVKTTEWSQKPAEEIDLAGLIPHLRVARRLGFDHLMLGDGYCEILEASEDDTPVDYFETRYFQSSEMDFKDDRPYDRGAHWSELEEIAGIPVSYVSTVNTQPSIPSTKLSLSNSSMSS